MDEVKPLTLGTVRDKKYVMLVGGAPFVNFRLTFGLPKLYVVLRANGPGRATLPHRSPVPAVVAALPSVSVKPAVVVRSVESVSMPATEALLPSVTPGPLLLIVSPPNGVADVPPMVCAAEPTKATVLPLAVKVPLFVQAPGTVMVVAFVPASVAPASICTAP